MRQDQAKLMVAGLRSLKPYEPGKSIEELQRELGLSSIIKLASNENPRAPMNALNNVLHSLLPEISRYPDGGGYQLKRVLADRLSVNPAQITLGNGSNDVLELIARAFVEPRLNVIVSEHAFAVYTLVTKSVGADLRVVPAINWGHNLELMTEAIDQQTRVVFIAHPNNPPGTWVDKSSLVDFLDVVPSDTLVVLDEAYFEYVEEETYPNSIELLHLYPNLIVTRTFSKIYGLAGLRVGYSVSTTEIAEILNRVRQPFNVNSIGNAAALAVLTDERFVIESRTLNSQQLAYVCNSLQTLGLEWIPSVGNFVSIDFNRPAQTIYERMLHDGVIVRPIANYGLPNHLRMTIGLEEENSIALDALSKAIKD
mgnify:CR=1 FL=1